MRPKRLMLTTAFAVLSLVASASGAAAAGHSGGASARGVESMPIYRAHGARPRPSSPNLVSHGGAVQTSPKVYISFWGPEWANGFATGGYTSGQAQAYITGFFDNIGGTPWNGVATQYCQGIPSGSSSCAGQPSTSFVGNPDVFDSSMTWSDPTSVPNKPTQSQIAAAALRLASHFGGIDPNATYFVFTPTGKSMSGFKTSWCAWHSSASSGGQSYAYAYMPYIPDAGSSCGMNFVNATSNAYGNGYFDGFSVVGGHEFSEAETDPFPSSGWTDAGGAENADKCAWSSMSTNLSLGGRQYAVQPTWSNAISGCSNG
jgi:hypothetical protein